MDFAKLHISSQTNRENKRNTHNNFKMKQHEMKLVFHRGRKIIEASWLMHSTSNENV